MIWKCSDQLGIVQDWLGEVVSVTVRFDLQCAKFDLLGVPKPFWADWWGADPCKFLMPDSLHLFSVFFRDNPLKWIIRMSDSGLELDFRIQIQPRCVGVYHYNHGMTKLQRVVVGTGQCQLQCLVAVASRSLPGVSRKASAVICAITDIIFICCYSSHDKSTIGLLTEAIARFHSHKFALLECKACSSFRIPKLEKMQHVARHI